MQRVEDRISPVLTEPVARGFGDFIGGPVGRYALVGRQHWWTPRRVLIAVGAVFLALGYLIKSPCLAGKINSDGSVGVDWSGARQYNAACYTDIIPLFSGRGMDKGGFPYAYSWVEEGITRYQEYPVLGGLFQGLNGWLTRLSSPLIQALPGTEYLPTSVIYFMWTAVTMSIMWIATICLVQELTGRRTWDTVLVAASPIIPMHAFTNWDIPAIFLATLALWAASKNKLLWAGTLVGAGAAFKLWPLFLLGAYLVLAVRHRRFRGVLEMSLTAVGTWLFINLPVALLYPDAWREFYRMNSARGWEWTTIYAILSRETGWSGFPHDDSMQILDTVTFCLFAACCLAILIYGLLSPRPPRVAELVFLILVSFLLFNKVWSPQYSLWLVVPAVLALPRWRLLLTWMSVEFIVWPVLCWHMMGEEHKGIPGGLLDCVLIVRDGLLLLMVVLVILQIQGRVTDKVLAAEGKDPLLPESLEPVDISERAVERVNDSDLVGDFTGEPGAVNELGEG